MKSIPPLLLADLKASCTTLAFLWTIEKGNGEIIRGTEHDRDVILPGSGDTTLDKYAGTYKAIANVTMGDLSSATDLSVDNMEVTGAFPDKTDDSPQYATVINVRTADIEDGLLDMAPVSILVCNWAAPSNGYWVAGGGTIGQITRDSDGKYTTEVRGLTQLLQQMVLRTYSESCNAQFGDNRCKLPVPQTTGQVGAVTDRSTFAVDLDSGSGAMRFVAGNLKFTTGANAGLQREVKTDPNLNGGMIEFWEPFPNDVNTADEFDLQAGCDKFKATCVFYGNLRNIRAHGSFIPGVMKLTMGPTTPQELG